MTNLAHVELVDLTALDEAVEDGLVALEHIVEGVAVLHQVADEVAAARLDERVGVQTVDKYVKLAARCRRVGLVASEYLDDGHHGVLASTRQMAQNGEDVDHERLRAGRLIQQTREKLAQLHTNTHTLNLLYSFC